ncbi:hypothetical protein NECAME_03603 [Necator americanus]|uniref:Netrin receptor UNC5A-D-like N-terminal domain-containing protein n=1 Tax=Necator americanus TaxID=51031 RepID=W2T4Z5_NECAM|nr:hypothetical protein NECAME_03603 [Necator americanus]ETN76037.1 hypothetical protein NECAME_03603 [Necator americanus]
MILAAVVDKMMEEVVLIEQPQSGHVIKSRPYRLSCKAVNARKIRFKCNNKWGKITNAHDKQPEMN